MNSVRLSGWITRAPNLQFTGQGKQFCFLTLKSVEKGYQGREYASWHNVVGWGEIAEDMANLKQNDFIYLEGVIGYRKDDASGQFLAQIKPTLIERIAEPGATQVDTSTSQARDDNDDIPW